MRSQNSDGPPCSAQSVGQLFVVGVLCVLGAAALFPWVIGYAMWDGIRARLKGDPDGS